VWYIAPVGFWGKIPLLAKKSCAQTLAVFLKPLEKSNLKSGPPDNKKEIYIKIYI
jgi:hypothetical protein